MKITNLSKREVKVKSFTRKGKLVKSYKRKINESKKKLNIVSTLGIGAASALGLTTTTYLILKGKYRKGLVDSANWVKNNASKINVPDLTEAELKRNNINFAVGGLGYENNLKKSTNLASYVEKKFKGHTVAVDTTSFNKLPEVAPKNVIKVSYDLNKTKIKEALIKGYNPTARELAATMYAYHKKYPTHTMVSFGHSYGGAITDEAINILSKTDVDMTKFRNVSYGATYNGILDTAPNSLNIVDVNDWQTKLKKFPNSVTIGKKKPKKSTKFVEKFMEDHGSYHYLSSPEAIEKTKQFIAAPKDWKPPIKVAEKAKSVKNISKNTKDNVSEEVRILREVRRKVSAAVKGYKTIENSSNIPDNKKQKVLIGAQKKIDNAREEYELKKKAFKDKVASIRKQKETN